MRISILLAFIALLAIIAIPNFVNVACGCGSSSENECINNLRQIDGAKEQWALENHKKPGDIVTANDIGPYIKNGLPECPKGGKYTIGRIGENPTCSVPGHSL